MAKSKKDYTEICPQLIQELGQIKEERKALQEREKPLVAIVKETWKEVASKKRRIKDEEGNVKTTYTYRPKGCDYEAVMSVFQRTDVQWKEEFKKFYSKVKGPKAYRRFVKNLPTTEQTQLDVNLK